MLCSANGTNLLKIKQNAVIAEGRMINSHFFQPSLAIVFTCHWNLLESHFERISRNCIQHGKNDIVFSENMKRKELPEMKRRLLKQNCKWKNCFSTAYAYNYKVRQQIYLTENNISRYYCLCDWFESHPDESTLKD